MRPCLRRRETFWKENFRKLKGYGFWLANYQDIAVNRESCSLVSEFVAKKIRQRIKDPKVADKLIPKDHFYGTRRVPLENNYDAGLQSAECDAGRYAETPIERVTPTGIKTTNGDAQLERYHRRDPRRFRRLTGTERVNTQKKTWPIACSNWLRR